MSLVAHGFVSETAPAYVDAFLDLPSAKTWGDDIVLTILVDEVAVYRATRAMVRTWVEPLDASIAERLREAAPEGSFWTLVVAGDTCDLGLVFALSRGGEG